MPFDQSPFYRQLAERIAELGGMHNAHLHLDRAGTLEEQYLQIDSQSVLESSYISLHEKHHLIHAIHSGPAYQVDDMRTRVNHYLDIMVAVGTKRADTLVDVTADGVDEKALQLMLELKAERAREIDLRVAAYSPLGFRNDEPQRWELFAGAAAKADFIAALPEADDVQEYPGHIGFEEHVDRFLQLASEKQCPLHVHTDQRNEPGENGTERLLARLRQTGPLARIDGEPAVWAVHMISPSTYDEARFRQLVDNMLELDVGLICCPSAAIGMRQIRPLLTPTYNSIPRVLELLAAGVQVKLASDNIADICSPSTTANLVDEVFVLSAALRFYHVDILARLAAGVALDERGRAQVSLHLQRNEREIEKVLREYHQKDPGKAGEVLAD